MPDMCEEISNHEIKQQHAGDQLYDEKFYELQKELCHRYASVILPIVNRFVHPRTVIDVGCALGGWLDYWQKNFGTDIYGVDGDYTDMSRLSIDKKYFHTKNLEERIELDRRFDLVQSLEVAEHLSPERAESFIEDLTKLGDVVLFSSPTPTTSGINHINCQWQSYWLKQFLKFGYVGVDCIRRKIWSDERLSICRREDIFIYVKSTEMYRYPELQKFYLENRDNTIYDIVHPVHLMQLQNEIDQMRSGN